MAQEFDSRIKDDIELLEGRIRVIENGDGPNFAVYKSHYTFPTLIRDEEGTSLPLSDSTGNFLYSIRIRDALKLVVEGKQIPKALAPPGAPDYVMKHVGE